VDPLYGGTSNPPKAGGAPVSSTNAAYNTSGTGPQPVSTYQTALGAPPGIAFNSGDPAAGIVANNAADTTGAVVYPYTLGLPDVALAVFSSFNGLSVTIPGALNPSYVGAGFFTPSSVTSSGNPYAYVGGDPVNGVDPGGEGWAEIWSAIIAGIAWITGGVIPIHFPPNPPDFGPPDTKVEPVKPVDPKNRAGEARPKPDENGTACDASYVTRPSDRKAHGEQPPIVLTDCDFGSGGLLGGDDDGVFDPE